MTEAGRLIKEAYIHTAEQVENGKRFAKRFEPIWEKIQEGYITVTTVPGAEDHYDMYDVCYAAGREYDDRVSHIGIDNAFSTVIDAIGVHCYSEGWYRVMAHHYTKQAERKSRPRDDDYESEW